MKRQTIKKLASASFVKNGLDSRNVSRVTKILKREDLKIYIKDLKNIEAKRSVLVTLPSASGINEIKSHFSKIYPGKRIVFNVDESLLSGIKVVDYDNVYELSLRGLLENSLKGPAND